MEYPNWFESTGAINNFERHLRQHAGKPVDFLQIGAYTGDASEWMLREILSHPDSTLTDVDTWEGSDEASHHEMDFDDVFKTYEKKVGKYHNLTYCQQTSNEFFLNNKKLYDFIYIDGDHTAFGVMRDVMNAYGALKAGGIIACDDYQWSEGKGNYYDPRPAIDAFFNITRDRFTVIEIGWQVWFKHAAQATT
jgi:predicted O-methyltransferase YrrM